MHIIIRPVKQSDLDALVEIVIQAFPHDEQFAYRYPHREAYPDDHVSYTRRFYAEYLSATQAGKNAIMVAEAPDPDPSDPSRKKVIGMSIWDNPGVRSALHPYAAAVPVPRNRPERRDADPRRLETYAAATAAAREALFVRKFGERQLSLRQMATLPAYWGQGAASKMLRWGMERARCEGVAVPVFAGNTGRRLYTRHGFKVLGEVRVQVEGEEEALEMLAMAWDAKEEGGEVEKKEEENQGENGAGWSANCIMS